MRYLLGVVIVFLLTLLLGMSGAQQRLRASVETLTPVSTQFLFLPVIYKSVFSSPPVSSTPTITPSTFRFTMQNNYPTYVQNFANVDGCNWQGFAGQGFDLSRRPIVGLIVHIEGGGINYDAITGASPAYGLAGYELFLTSTPIATTTTFRMQLRNQAAEALSDWYYVATFANNSDGSCPQNLGVANFLQNH